MGQAAEEQLTRDIEARRAELSRDLDSLTDKVSPSQIMERRKEATRGKLRNMRDKVMGSAQDTRQGFSSAGSNATDSMRDGTQNAAGTVQRQTQGNPLAAGAIAFGAGWLMSSLMPASEKETRLAQEAVDRAKESPLMDEAKSVGQEMGENLKGSATEAADQVKSTAQESAENVKAEGQSSAENVKAEGQSRAQNVQQDVQSRSS